MLYPKIEAPGLTQYWETDSGGHKQNLVCTRTQEKGAVTPQETDPVLPVSVQESLVVACACMGPFEGVLFSLSFFKTTLLTYDQHTESCTCLMNLETSIQPWNHLYYLCHKHIHYHQKVFFLPSLFICYYYSLKEFSIALQVLLLLKLYTFLKVIHNLEIFSSINIGKVFKNKIPVITRQN